MTREELIKALVIEIEWAHNEYKKQSDYINSDLGGGLLDYLFDLHTLLKEVIIP